MKEIIGQIIIPSIPTLPSVKPLPPFAPPGANVPVKPIAPPNQPPIPPLENQPVDCELCIGEENFSLAMAYVPRQIWRNVYESETGFNRGTIFKELDLPFLGEEAVPRGR